MPFTPREKTPVSPGKVLGLIFGGLVVFAILFSFLAPYEIVDAGHRGVLVRLGQVQDEVLEEGFHWYNPLTSDIRGINVQTTSIAFDSTQENPLGAASKDLQEVSISVIVNYHPDPKLAPLIFQQFGTGYETNIVSPIVREVVKNASAQFTAEELVTRRADFTARINTDLASRFTEKMMVFERSNVVNIDFSDSFNKAIEAKVTAEQEALAQKNKLEEVKFRAQQQIETSKAEAEAIRIKAEAVNKQGGADYVRLKAIEKWDGRLPQYQLGGGVTPFVDIQSLK